MPLKMIFLAIVIIIFIAILHHLAVTNDAKYSSAPAPSTSQIPSKITNGTNDPISNDPYVREMMKPKSATLKAYEDAAGPFDGRIGMANALVQCNLKSMDWYQMEVETDQNELIGPQFELITPNLTDEEQKEAKNFDYMTAKYTQDFYTGKNNSNCATLARWPIAQ